VPATTAVRAAIPTRPGPRRIIVRSPFLPWWYAYPV
jgi:hypothetical protein